MKPKFLKRGLGMVRKVWLSLLIFLFMGSVTASAARLENVRHSYGSGTLRIVLDLTEEIEFVESTAENPSRSIIDLQNTTVSNEFHNYVKELNSTAAKRIRVARFNDSTVRVVIETMAAIKIFKLNRRGQCRFQRKSRIKQSAN